MPDKVQTLSVNGTLAQLYFWDARSGHIRCVTEPGYTASLCDGDGSAQPGLRDWYKFDPLDRLKAFKSYRSQDTIDSSYVYDAFDRVSTETQAHDGGPARTSDFGYLGIGGEVSSETQRGSSASKRFSYDVDDARIGATITTSGTHDYSFARNPHGDTSLLVDDDGTLRASYAYKPYGQLDLSLARNDSDPADSYNPFRFNDKRFDTGSRSIDMGARHYEPDDGRFLQQDFLRDASDDFELSTDMANENRYAFAGGNPVTFAEEDGHKVGPGGGGRRCPFKPVTYPTPKQRIKYSYNFFRSKGLPPVQCAAIIGNFWAETTVSPLNPAQGEIKGFGGIGIAQWTDIDGSKRKTRLRNVARNHGCSWRNLRLQLFFAWKKELHDTHNQARLDLQQYKFPKQVVQATTTFKNDYEGFGVGRLPTRICYARAVLSRTFDPRRTHCPD